MSKLWHLMKYNLIFYKVKLVFQASLAFFLLMICLYFYESDKELGEALMQYSFFIFFINYTGKINSKAGMMFDIKHLVALPLSKRELVFLKSFADAVEMLPISLVFLYGFSMAFPNYHILFVSFLLFLTIVFANIISLNKRVDFSRMQHSKASLRNWILYIHKYLELNIQIAVAIFTFLIIFALFRNNIFLQEYSLLVFIVTALVVGGFGTLKMLSDETRSYFMFKRDSLRIGAKLIVFLIPWFIFDQIYSSNYGKKVIKENEEISSMVTKHIKKLKGLSSQRALIMIVKKDKKGLKDYLESGKEIPWETEILGNYPLHLSVITDDLEIVKTIAELNPKEINKIGKKNQFTPLFSAIKRCNLEIMDYLITKGATINHQDVNGNTPMIYAAKRKCYGGVVLLKNHGALVTLENQKGKNIFDYLKGNHGIAYLLKENTSNNTSSKRLPASTKTK